MTTYTTISGDTWDWIAKKTLGKEIYADQIMQANFDLLDTFIFSSGVTIVIPDLEEEVNIDLPVWRR